MSRIDVQYGTISLFVLVTYRWTTGLGFPSLMGAIYCEKQIPHWGNEQCFLWGLIVSRQCGPGVCICVYRCALSQLVFISHVQRLPFPLLVLGDRT